MTGAAHYRRLLGGLFLFALLPFPFLYIVMQPFWLAAALAGAFLFWRPERPIHLSLWVKNLLGVLVVVVVALAGGIHVGPLRPLGHLLLLLTAIQAITVDDRRTFLRALAAVALVWVIAVTSSTHVSAVLYVAASAVVWTWAGMEVVLLGLPPAGLSRPPAPRLGHAAVAGGAALVLAIPVFLTMPRLRSPWVAAVAGVRSVSGFNEVVDLSGWKVVAESQETALVLRTADGGPVLEPWTRLRGAALDLLLAGTWAPRRSGLVRPPSSPDGVVSLTQGPPRLERAVELSIEMRRPSAYLFLPEGAVALRSPLPVLADPVGGITLGSPPPGPLTYTVWALPTPRPRLDPPRPRDLRLPLANPEVAALARAISAGSRSPEARARAVEAFLQDNYGYSLNASAGNHRDPVAWFLFEQREGHCEFFAGTMVVMLRNLGVPARMVAGYSGGALDEASGRVVVAEANAHAWVEAWCGRERGWLRFDPTPAGEVPALRAMSARERARRTWEWIESSWDRYVLTFGLGEQITLARSLAASIASLRAHLGRRELLLVVFALAVALTLRWAARRPRRRLVRLGRRGPAAAAIDRVARRLRRAGHALPPGATVRQIGDRGRSAWPAASGALGELVWLAERELYAPAAERPASAVPARRLWVTVRRESRRSRPREARDPVVRAPPPRRGESPDVARRREE